MSEMLVQDRPVEEVVVLVAPDEVVAPEGVEPEVVEPEHAEPGAVEPEHVEPEAVEPEHEAEQPAPRARRGRKAHAAEAPAEATPAGPEVVAEVVEEAPAEDAAEEAATQPEEAPRAPRGPRAWLGALAARGAERRAAAAETQRLDEIAHAHAESERALAREAAALLPKDHTPEQLRDKIAEVRQEHVVAAQKAEDLKRADQLDAEAEADFRAAAEQRTQYEAALRLHDQAVFIVAGAEAQMATAVSTYRTHFEHGSDLKRQAAALRAQYAEPVAA
jgi:hypothetical protein